MKDKKEEIEDFDLEEESICPDCGEPCKVIPLKNDYDFAGTHCTHGRAGTHYPDSYGDPVSDCCEAFIEPK